MSPFFCTSGWTTKLWPNCGHELLNPLLRIVLGKTGSSSCPVHAPTVLEGDMHFSLENLSKQVCLLARYVHAPTVLEGHCTTASLNWK